MVTPQTLCRRGGFLLLEAMLGLTLFGMFLTAAVLVLLQGQEGSIAGGDRVRATFIADGALEASRAIRDASFAALTEGPHGVGIVNDLWTYAGSQSASSGGYMTSVTVTPLAADWASLSARTAWRHGLTSSGSVRITTELTDWRRQRSVGNWSSVTLTGSVTIVNAQFNDIAFKGNYAYVTSEVSGGGAGLYVLNVANMAIPSVAATVNLGAAGYHAALRGNVLYVVTADASAEIKAYDITAPTSPSLKVSYNLPGSALGRGLLVDGTRLYVTGIPNAGAGERALYSFDVSSSGAIVLLEALDDTGTPSAIAMTATSALLADTDDVLELRTARATATGALAWTGGVNLTDGTWDALSIATSGTSALLGRERNTLQELVVFDVRSGGVSLVRGPWYHEGSGSLVAVDADGNGCFGFLAAASGRKALQVVNLFDKTNLPELTTYTSTSGLARGLGYDHVRDKVYLLTDNAVLLFQAAGAAPGPCP